MYHWRVQSDPNHYTIGNLSVNECLSPSFYLSSYYLPLSLPLSLSLHPTPDTTVLKVISIPHFLTDMQSEKFHSITERVYYVLVSFKLSLLANIQFFAILNELHDMLSVLSRDWSCNVWKLFISWMAHRRSFIYTRGNIDPNTDPWGTRQSRLNPDDQTWL